MTIKQVISLAITELCERAEELDPSDLAETLWSVARLLEKIEDVAPTVDWRKHTCEECGYGVGYREPCDPHRADRDGPRPWIGMRCRKSGCEIDGPHEEACPDFVPREESGD